MILSYGGAKRSIVVPFLWNTDLADVTDLRRYF